MFRFAFLALAALGACVYTDRRPERASDPDPMTYPRFEGAYWRQWAFAHKPFLDWRIAPHPIPWW